MAGYIALVSSSANRNAGRASLGCSEEARNKPVVSCTSADDVPESGEAPEGGEVPVGDEVKESVGLSRDHETWSMTLEFAV